MNKMTTYAGIAATLVLVSSVTLSVNAATHVGKVAEVTSTESRALPVDGEVLGYLGDEITSHCNTANEACGKAWKSLNDAAAALP